MGSAAGTGGLHAVPGGRETAAEPQRGARPIFVLNGPNLGLLGQRQPDTYGAATLADIEALCRAEAAQHGLGIDFRQSEHEGTLVEWLREAHRGAGVIFGFGARSYVLAVRAAAELARTPHAA
jgi:3-dehydroquinate dehydratase-2